MIRYTRRIDVGKVVAATIRHDNAVVVVHGIDYNGNGIYDYSALDRSDLKRSLPGEMTAPALCGPLVPASKPPGSGTKTGRVPGGRQIYTASLELSGATKLDGADHAVAVPARRRDGGSAEARVTRLTTGAVQSRWSPSS